MLCLAEPLVHKDQDIQHVGFMADTFQNKVKLDRDCLELGLWSDSGTSVWKSLDSKQGEGRLVMFQRASASRSTHVFLQCVVGYGFYQKFIYYPNFG